MQLSEKVDQRSKHMVNMSTERSKPLHNFSLPSLRWGNQRYLRCMKVDSNGEILSGSDHRKSSASEDSDSDVLNLVKEKSLKNLPPPQSSSKLVIHLQTSAKKNETQDDDESGAARPWNLRTRRAVCKSPNNESGGSKLQNRPSQPQSHSQQNCSFKKPEIPSPKSLRLRGLAAMAANQGMPANQGKRREFLKSLTRDEIKEDFLAMTGNNPARRPKKRSKITQKQINNLFPGFWLTEVTTDSYKVADELVDTMKK